MTSWWNCKGVAEWEFYILHSELFVQTLPDPVLLYLVITSHMHSDMILNKLAISQKIIISMAILQISSTTAFCSYSTCFATVAWPIFRCNIIIHTFMMILTKFISSPDDQFHDRTTHPDRLAPRDLTLHDSVAIFNLCNWNLIATLACVEIKSPIVLNSVSDGSDVLLSGIFLSLWCYVLLYQFGYPHYSLDTEVYSLL